MSKLFLLALTFMLAVPDAMTAATAQPKPWDFKGPFGVAVDSRGTVYVAEINNKRIARFTADGQWLGVIERIEGYGSFEGPFDVAVGPEDRILIVDTFANQVLVLDRDQRLQFVLGKREKSAAPGCFIQPHFVTTNRKGEIFVSDTFNARIQKFTPDGKFIKAWGKIGPGPGEFLHNGYVGGIACDDQGFVYVRETDGGRIQKFTDKGKYVATIGRRGNAPGEFDEGYGVVVSGETLWVIDTFASRIQRLSLEGKLIDVWSPGEGNSGERFNHPVDLAVLADGNVIVSDWKNNRVLKLSKEGKFLETWGLSLDDALAWQPPARVKRASDHHVVFSAYAGLGEKDLLACRDAHIEIIYPSFDKQTEPWTIGPSVQRARELGVKVAPSIAMWPFGSNTEFGRANPQLGIWKRGGTGPINILSWGQPQVRTYRAQTLRDRIEHSGVDGLMLDYIRYLDNDYCYDPIVIEAYKSKYGIDPNTLPTDDPQWMQFRADYVTDFIVELRRELARLDRIIEVSAYAGSEPKVAMRNSMKDWPTWVKMGIIDKLNLGIYTRDMQEIYDNVKRLRDTVPPRTKINCFVACYGGNLNTPELLKKGIDAAVAAGADEITIYRSDTIWELNLWPAIKEAAEATNPSR